MAHPHIHTRLRAIILSVFSFSFSACIQDNPHLSDRDERRPPFLAGCMGIDVSNLCAPGEYRSADPCKTYESNCRLLETDAVCNTMGPIYCRADCAAIEPRLTCPEGFVECEPGTDTNCRLEHPSNDACTADVYCRPTQLCNDVLRCGDNESLHTEPCGAHEPDCRRISACHQFAYCRAETECPPIAQAFSCPDQTIECDDLSDERCFVVVEGDGRCTPTVACRPACNEMGPSCGVDETETSSPCQPGELGCRIVSACDQEIYCRETTCEPVLNPCEHDEVSSDEACMAWEEDICRRIDDCGETTYCRRPVACPAYPGEPLPCPDGLTQCDPNSDDECILVFEGDECEPPLYCAPDSICSDPPPRCPGGYVERAVPCVHNDPSCLSMAFCGGLLHCEESQHCRQQPQCRAGETPSEQPCRQGEPECRDMSACGVRFACRPNVQCDAFPSCQVDEIESEVSCGPDEECRAQWACGTVIFCRPIEQCLLMPECRPDEDASGRPCDPTEVDCRAETRCGATVFCRTVEPCPAVTHTCPENMVECDVADPTCLAFDVGHGQCAERIYCEPRPECNDRPRCRDDEEASNWACEPGEPNCRTVSMCNESLACRMQHVEAQLSRCGERPLPVDEFEIEAVRIAGDELIVTTLTSGGCVEHDFEACYRPIDPNEPVQYRMTIGLDTYGDDCEGLVRRDISFNVEVIQHAYRTFFGAESGQISLFITGAPHPVVYRF